MHPPEDPQYIPRAAVNASYRPKSYVRSFRICWSFPAFEPSQVMSPGLRRAREPYRLRNAITGLTLAAFGVGVWAYSISAVRQDVFDDVDEEARRLAASGGVNKSSDGERRA